ncbi:conserved hypothetical protein [Paenibacillus curdlanolyticus YK9]|uniref:Glycosyl transferase family 2 n=1 Tax=Paenibacillus curdlanolyticus YK9 TaxID=717606 RepID=E0IED9_9BACL|nr:hypothetical protein [Paenibacillus curdlanolyticus]EFM09027.1 conserved hypothetical protein [Paenibacillus curdlanolyticus YK9]
MISLLALVLGSYVLAALSVHLIRYYASRRNKAESRHYVLFARNDAPRMEWFIRSIHWFSSRSGTDVRITIVDCGSSDETVAIAGRLASSGLEYIVDDAYVDHGRQLRSSSYDRGTARTQAGLNGRFAEAGDGLARTNQSVFVDLNRPEDLAKLPLF